MFPLSAIADSKSKTVTREECIELAKIIYGRVFFDNVYPYFLFSPAKRCAFVLITWSKSQLVLISDYKSVNYHSREKVANSLARELTGLTGS